MWFSIVWLSVFACRAVTSLLPGLLRRTIGLVSLQSRHYIAYLAAVESYLALFVWSLVVWITWLAIVWGHFQNPNAPLLSPLASGSATNTTLVVAQASQDTASEASSMVAVGRFFLGACICTFLLLAEKVCIQIIAYNFHQVSYASRIADCKFHLDLLSRLYSLSKRDLTEPDTDLDAEKPIVGSLKSGGSGLDGLGSRYDTSAQSENHGYGFGRAAAASKEKKRQQSTSQNNALAAAAADMSMRTVLLPGSAERVVLLALTSADQTKHLARRLFFSFARKNKDGTLMIKYVDLAAVLGEEQLAQSAWATFDQDENGDILEEEMLQACQLIRKERQSVINSVRDIGSAVGSLDSMFMVRLPKCHVRVSEISNPPFLQSFYTVISCTIIAALLSVKFSSLVTSLGSVVLGLSWLISGNAQELLQAIVFLFVKHPYDVGDLVYLVDLKQEYVVDEMRMLSTVFRTMSGESFQIGNAKLATGNGVINLRRSGPIEEPYEFDVAYGTTYQQLENLRAKMLLWLAEQKRDFLPGLDIQIKGMSAPTSMQLTVGIRYKSNIQEYHLKQQRRNRWLCHFKELLAELQIHGPDAEKDEKPAWASKKGDAAREAVRGGVDREYILMDQRESDNSE